MDVYIYTYIFFFFLHTHKIEYISNYVYIEYYLLAVVSGFNQNWMGMSPTKESENMFFCWRVYNYNT